MKGEFVFRCPGRRCESARIDEGIDCVHEALGPKCQSLVESRIDILELADVEWFNRHAELLGL
jgi:hypothetical protein